MKHRLKTLSHRETIIWFCLYLCFFYASGSQSQSTLVNLNMCLINTLATQFYLCMNHILHISYQKDF